MTVNTMQNFNKTHNLSILQPQQTIYNSYQDRNKWFLQEIKHLIQRLVIQTIRRPSSLLSGIIQPLLWLVLFGNLFQNTTIGIFTTTGQYGEFLSCGIIIFTSFTGSLNAGLPIIFDREFGFLNRLLVAPMISRQSLLVSSSLFMISLTMLQTIIIICFSLHIFNNNTKPEQILLFFIITLLVTSSISNFSLCLAFILPGHIEYLAFTLLTNLPMLFSSTALAPLSFMPYWLQIIANLNPLTYGIESIRFISKSKTLSELSNTIDTLWINTTLLQSIFYLTIFSFTSFISMKTIITNRLE